MTFETEAFAEAESVRIDGRESIAVHSRAHNHNLGERTANIAQESARAVAVRHYRPGTTVGETHQEGELAGRARGPDFFPVSVDAIRNPGQSVKEVADDPSGMTRPQWISDIRLDFTRRHACRAMCRYCFN